MVSGERAHESEAVEETAAAVAIPAPGLAPPIGNRAFSALVQTGGRPLPRAALGHQVSGVLARAHARRVLARDEPTRDERIEAFRKSLEAARTAGTPDWTDVAVKLNGLSTADVARLAAGMKGDEISKTRAAAERDLRDKGWPIQHLLNGLDNAAGAAGVKIRPRGASIWRAYDPVKYPPNDATTEFWSGVGGPEAWDIVGGFIGNSYGPNSNSCATRLSYAFNYGGWPIRDRDDGWIYFNSPKVTYDKPIPESILKKPGDGLRYILSARYMEGYLKKKWGKPEARCKDKTETRAFASGLTADQVAIFAGPEHAGVMRRYTGTSTDVYRDKYIFTADNVFPVSIWVLP